MKELKKSIYLPIIAGTITFSLIRYFPPLLYVTTIVALSFGLLYSTIWIIRHKKPLFASVMFSCLSISSFSFSALKIIENYFPLYQRYMSILDVLSVIGVAIGFGYGIFGVIRNGDSNTKKLGKWLAVFFIFIAILYWIIEWLFVINR